jgi:hypothetical protein
MLIEPTTPLHLAGKQTVVKLIAIDQNAPVPDAL